MPRRWFGFLAFAAFEIATTGVSAFGQTVTVDASEAIRQIHMSDMITSGKQLQQQRFQSMMQQPPGGGYGGDGAAHYSHSEIDELARKTQTLDAFLSDAAVSKKHAHTFASAYNPETGGEDKMLADWISQTHDTKGRRERFRWPHCSLAHDRAKEQFWKPGIGSVPLLVPECFYSALR